MAHLQGKPIKVAVQGGSIQPVCSPTVHEQPDAPAGIISVPLCRSAQDSYSYMNVPLLLTLDDARLTVKTVTGWQGETFEDLSRKKPQALIFAATQCAEFRAK